MIWFWTKLSSFMILKNWSFLSNFSPTQFSVSRSAIQKRLSSDMLSYWISVVLRSFLLFLVGVDNWCKCWQRSTHFELFAPYILIEAIPYIYNKAFNIIKNIRVWMHPLWTQLTSGRNQKWLLFCEMWLRKPQWKTIV